MEEPQEIPTKYKIIGAVAAAIILLITLVIFRQLSNPERLHNFASDAEKAQLDDIRQAVVDGEAVREQSEQNADDIWDITKNPDYTGESNAVPEQAP